jgi:hypothetical protein
MNSTRFKNGKKILYQQTSLNLNIDVILEERSTSDAMKL